MMTQQTETKDTDSLSRIEVLERGIRRARHLHKDALVCELEVVIRLLFPARLSIRRTSLNNAPRLKDEPIWEELAQAMETVKRNDQFSPDEQALLFWFYSSVQDDQKHEHIMRKLGLTPEGFHALLERYHKALGEILDISSPREVEDLLLLRLVVERRPYYF